MIKNREEVEKEFDYVIGGLHHNDDSYATDHVHLRISKIRKDDIVGLVEWAEKEKKIVCAFVNSKGSNIEDKYIHYTGGKMSVLRDIIAHLQELKEKV
jgi:hypothetical protein